MSLSHTEQKILKALLEIRKNGPEDSYVGICTNLETSVELFNGTYESIEETSIWLESKFPLWPKFSGDINYPISSSSEVSPNKEYISADELWEGKYGELRYELLDFLISQLTEKDSQP